MATLHRLSTWLSSRSRAETLAVRASAAAIILLLIGALGRSSSPPRSWSSTTSTTYGAFLCPAFLGEPRILLNPSIGAASPDDAMRRLTILHEAVHARQAAEFGSCWLFNAAMRIDPTTHLRFEARAHCAEVRQQLAWRDRDRGDGRFSRGWPRDRWWRWYVGRIARELTVEGGNYARIAALGEATVLREVMSACGSVPAFPVPDHPLLDSPDVPVVVG